MTNPRSQAIALQARWSLAEYRDAGAFARFVERLMELAERQRAPDVPCLVAFPEFIGLPLLFLDAPELSGCTNWREAVALLTARYALAAGELMNRFGVGPMRALLLALAERNRDIYCSTFAAAAKAHDCYLVAGSIALPDPPGVGPEDAKVFNVAHFFGPDGSLLGTQKKRFPYGLQGMAEGLDISPAPAGAERAFSTPFGKVGIAVCFDAFQEEVMGALAAAGAEIVVQPTANAHPWDPWQAGDWERGLLEGVRRHSIIRYGVNPMMVGSIFSPADEYTCQGRSSIIAKAEANAGSAVYLARASERHWGEYGQEEAIWALLKE